MGWILHSKPFWAKQPLIITLSDRPQNKQTKKAEKDTILFPEKFDEITIAVFVCLILLCWEQSLGGHFGCLWMASYSTTHSCNAEDWTQGHVFSVHCRDISFSAAPVSALAPRFVSSCVSFNKGHLKKFADGTLWVSPSPMTVHWFSNNDMFPSFSMICSARCLPVF